MDIFGVLQMLGGLCLFLFGMETMRGNGSHSELFGNDGDAGRVCEFRYHASRAGDSGHHGREHRYDGDSLAFESGVDRWQQLFYSAAQANVVFADSGRNRDRLHDVHQK